MQAIFSGQAGGWPGEFADKLGDMLGMEPRRSSSRSPTTSPSWRAESPGRFKASAEALDGPDDPCPASARRFMTRRAPRSGPEPSRPRAR